jgi:hypothetical protein
MALADLERSVLVNEMAHSLQAAMAIEELYRIAGRYAPGLFPGTSGALCVIDSSRNVIETMATWGDRSDCETCSRRKTAGASRRPRASGP